MHQFMPQGNRLVGHTHLPPLQLGAYGTQDWPLKQIWLPIHAFPHAPQLFKSVNVSLQELEQHCPVLQALPQPPQLFESLAVPTHVELQQLCPGWQGLPQ
jgi:hypothetical protein